jgi:hypothetical protein
LGLLYDRTFARFEDQNERKAQYYHEDYDTPIISFLIENPEAAFTGVGLGHAHLYAAPYQQWEEVYAYVAYRGYLRWVSETGLIGLTLFLLFYWNRARALKRRLGFMTPHDKIIAENLILGSHVLICIFMVSAPGNLRQIIFLCIGMMTALQNMTVAQLRNFGGRLPQSRLHEISR